MARASGVTIILDLLSVPLLEGSWYLADQGCIPGAAFRNLDYTERDTLMSERLGYNLKMIAHDAQTSGGLLMAVPPGRSAALLKELHESGHEEASVIGRAVTREEQALVLL